MILVLRTILAGYLAFSISCSSGGGGGDGTGTGAGGANKTDNSAFTNVSGTAKGQWSNGEALRLFISNTRMKLIANCENNQTIETEVGIKLSPTTITILDSSAVGSGNCSIDFKKGTVLNYTVKGDELFVQVDEQKQSGFTRVSPPNNANPGTGGASAKGTIELFTGQNCQGQRMIYTVGMDCSQLGGNISSIKAQGQACQNLEQPVDSRAECIAANQAAAKQGGRQ
jgi:hypothetical protein